VAALVYQGPAWLPGGNLQTIWAATLSRRHLAAAPVFTRERWATPDGDFIDVDHLASPGAARHLVLFHGLEGSSDSQYAQAFGSLALARGWAYSVPHFRGCSGELNLAPRAYHSGDFEEIGWILQRLRQRSTTPLLVVGISLGGNALLRWAEESGDSAAATAAAVASVCSPIDLAAAGRAIDTGFNWLVYSRMFLRTMKPRQVAAAPGPVRSRQAGRGAHAVRVRQRLHRPAARLPRHTRLLGPRLGQAAAGAHPHPGPGAERAQRPLRARRVAAVAGRGRPPRHPVAARPWWPCRLPRRRAARPHPGHAHRGGRLAVGPRLTLDMC